MSPMTAMKRTPAAAILLAMCVLPAQGGEGPSLDIVHKMTPIDTVPTKEVLRSVLQSPSNELAVLQGYALAPQLDFGVRLRAVRALPHFCSEQPIACRAAILGVLTDVDLALADPPGQKLLRRRAAIEALGAAHTGRPEDTALLADFLDDPSRDIRVAAARALRDLCDRAALEPLRRQRDTTGEVPQVVHAIDEAIAAIQQCGA